MSEKYPHVVTRVRASLVTGYGGQQVRDWPNAFRTSGLPANVQPETQSELTENRQTTITSWSLHEPGWDGGLLATDRVEWSGVINPETGALVPLEVDGDVEDWTRGDRGHIKARLKKASD